MRDIRSPSKVPVAAFKLSEHLSFKLEQNEKRRKRETQERVAGMKERLETMIEVARSNRKQLDDNLSYKHQ